ncbi:MAG TPA: aspartate carbamoyltransferase [Chlamydiales bacterium]|nr:aspartate carbamoyltransferase [Chlamydiales bacterium]
MLIQSPQKNKKIGSKEPQNRQNFGDARGLKSNLISIADLVKEDLHLVIQTAAELNVAPHSDLFKGLILANCFFEPSTRTRLSFETAMIRGGGSTIGFSGVEGISIKKEESLSDTIRTIGSYADVIVIRHPQEGAAREAANATSKPVINAGDGANQHPTQALIDLYSIQTCQNRLDSLHIAIVGDLKFGRTVHSLCQALAHFNARLYFVSPESLALPEPLADELKKQGVQFSYHSHFKDVLPKIDIFYMTRMQKERFSSEEVFTSTPWRLQKEHLERVKPNFRILHPMPRVDEIDREIDATPYAYYFQQAAHGTLVRMALLGLMLGRLP